MKNKIIYTSLIASTLIGCSFSSVDKNSFKILVPTGAPSVAFLDYLNDPNFETNTQPTNIVAEMLKGSKDIVVVDLIGGLTAIEKKSANYKLASVITFGNFYIYSTGHDENKVLEPEDTVVCFGQNNTPDILFNHLYPNIGVDYYQPGVSDIAPIASSGILDGNNVDYCIIAEPVLYNVMNNKNAPTYGKGYMYSDFQLEWKKQHGEDTSILGASIYVKNDTYESNKENVDKFLNKINNDINDYISNPSRTVEILNNYGSFEQQAQKIGLNSNVIEAVLNDSNSINLNYLSSSDDKFDVMVSEYLNVVNSSLINNENYL